MKLGVRGHDYGRLEPEELAKRISADGFSAVHLAPYKALALEGDFLQPHNIARVKRALDDAGIAIAVLGCYTEPGAADEEAFQANLNRFVNHLKVAKALGAGCVGTETTRYSGTEEGREGQYQQVLRFVKAAAAAAEEADALVGIEPVFRHTINSPEMTRRLLDEVQSRHVKVIFDPVNLLWEGNVPDQEALWESAIACFCDKVAVMHIKDGRYQGNAYTGLALGEGVARYQPIAKWLKNAYPDMTLIRDEALIPHVPQDIELMKRLFFGDEP